MNQTSRQKQIEGIVTNNLGFYDTRDLGYDPDQITTPEGLQAHLGLMDLRDCRLRDIDDLFNYNLNEIGKYLFGDDLNIIKKVIYPYI